LPFLLVFTAATLLSQSTSPMAFEVASLKHLSPGAAQSGGGGGTTRSAPTPPSPRSISYPNITLKELIRRAWKLTDLQVQGPSWMADEHYSLVAKVPEGAKQDDTPAMLQTLLKERFHLEVHHEQKPLAVYELTTARTGSKLKENDDSALREVAAKDPDVGNHLAELAPGTIIVKVGRGRMICKQVSMEKFAAS